MILLAFVLFKVYNKSNFRGRLIHRNINKWDFLPRKIGVDLYTSSTYTPENTVLCISFYMYGIYDTNIADHLVFVYHLAVLHIIEWKAQPNLPFLFRMP